MTASPNLPSVRDAKLPRAYVKAKDALETCEKIDECKDWRDRAIALASYARQAEDESLRKMATRIQARAIRRCGELLKQIEPKPGTRSDKPKGGSPPRSDGTRKAAGKAAGLSRDQQRDALRVASVPKRDFERQVESGGFDPPRLVSRREVVRS